MKIQKFKQALFCVVFLLTLFPIPVNACTYEEALNRDYSGYNQQDVIRILKEDLSQSSDLTYNQRKECLIGEMRDFHEDFSKYSKEIKYEALTAISALETGYFSSDVCKELNNVGGLCSSQGYRHFSTKEEGICALSQLLVQEYLHPEGAYYEGNTIIDVSQHYNTSPHWVELYVKVRLDMESRIPEDSPISETTCLLKKVLNERSMLCQNIYQINNKKYYNWQEKLMEPEISWL